MKERRSRAKPQGLALGSVSYLRNDPPREDQSGVGDYQFLDFPQRFADPLTSLCAALQGAVLVGRAHIAPDQILERRQGVRIRRLFYEPRHQDAIKEALGYEQRAIFAFGLLLGLQLLPARPEQQHRTISRTKCLRCGVGLASNGCIEPEGGHQSAPSYTTRENQRQIGEGDER